MKTQDNYDNSSSETSAIYFKTLSKISVTYVYKQNSGKQKSKNPYLAHTNMEDTVLQTDILFYLLHITD